MSDQVHRRFGRMFEFDRNGGTFEGTPAQRAAIRGAMKRYAEFGNRFDKVLFAMDVDMNKGGRRFIPISFVESDRFLGFCFPSLIQLNEQLLPDFIERTLFHEIGHMTAWRNLMTPRDLSEPWANAFEHWVRNGQPDGAIWDALKVRVDNAWIFSE